MISLTDLLGRIFYVRPAEISIIRPPVPGEYHIEAKEEYHPHAKAVIELGGQPYAVRETPEQVLAKLKGGNEL